MTFQASLTAILTIAFLTACGSHYSVNPSSTPTDEAKQEMFKEPTTVLPPTTPDSPSQAYSVYQLVEAKFGADTLAASVSAQIKITSTAGAETVDLVGSLRADGSASLVDLHPLPDAKNRLVAEALCVDVGVCKKIILNVYFNVEGKTLKRQFSSESLREPLKDPAAAPKPISPVAQNQELHPSERNLSDKADAADTKLGDYVGAPRNEILIGHLWERSQTPELPPVLTRAEDPAEVGPTLPAKVNAPVKTKTPAQTVRHDRDSRVFNRSGKTSAAPKATSKPPVKPSLETSKPQMPKPQTPKKQTPTTETAIERWMKTVSSWLNPPKKTQTPTQTPTPTPAHAPASAPKRKLVVISADPAKPAVVPPAQAPPAAAKPTAPAKQPGTSKPTAPPAPALPVPPDSTRPKARPLPTDPSAPREEKPVAPAPIRPDVSIYPFPPAKPSADSSALDQKIALLESRLAPMLNLRDGGIAEGGYADNDDESVRSSIIKASVLRTNIPGLVPVTINPAAHYGSGLLVSFLENSAFYLLKQLGLKLFVGDMSLKHGGSFGDASDHNTHQNGLDADIAWIGIAHPLRTSALTADGDVITGFDYEKTWNFLRLAQRQEIVEDAQKSTAISRVFMSPNVKIGFCSWAKKQNLLDQTADAELMRLLRPVKGHDKHFHLSLKCSPHYPLCRNLEGPPPPGTGCP